MLSLPCIGPQDLLAFEEALGKTSSPKEQKQLMKSLLLVGTANQLKALAVKKSVNLITNVVGKFLLYFPFNGVLSFKVSSERVDTFHLNDIKSVC